MNARRKRVIRELANLAPRKVIDAWEFDPGTDVYAVIDKDGTTHRINGQEVRDAR